MFDHISYKRATQALFVEHQDPAVPPVFTKAPFDRKIGNTVYISMKNVFLELEDPTEYLFVNKVFGGDWDHWQRVKNALDKYITPNDPFENWKAELEVRIRAKALKIIIDDANSNCTSTSIASAKWLVEKKWQPESFRKKSKKERIAEEEAQKGEVWDTVEEDAKRLSKHLRLV